MFTSQIRFGMLCAIALITLVACGGSDDESKSSDNSSKSSSQTSGGGRFGGFGGFGQEVKVEVLTLGRGAIASYHVSNGNLEAIERAPVYSRVGEVCTAVEVEEGEYVTAGQTLATLHRRDFQLDRDQAETDLSQSELAWRESSVELERATRYLERIIKDFEESKAAGRSSIFSLDDRFEAEIEKRKAELGEKRALADLERAESELERAQYQLDNTEILAPISGVLVSRMLNPFELVSENQEVFVIADLSSLRLEVDVPESAAAALQPNAATVSNTPGRPDGDGMASSSEDASEGPHATPANSGRLPRTDAEWQRFLRQAKAVILSATAYPDDRYLGYVEAVSPTVDAERGMLTVTIRVIPPAKIGLDLYQPLLAQLPVLERAAVTTTRDTVVQRAFLELPAAQQQGYLMLEPQPLEGEEPAETDPEAPLSKTGVALLAEDLPAAHKRLRPGMWLEANIVTHYEKDALLVPTTAIINATVFQITEPTADQPRRSSVVIPGREAPSTEGGAARRSSDGSRGGSEGDDEDKEPQLRAKAIDLTGFTGVTSEGYAELLPDAPLKAGDRVAIRGQEGLKDGSRVRIVGNTGE